MEKLTMYNAFVFIMIATHSLWIGLDPKRWQSWLLSVYGLFTFLLAGIEAENIYKSLEVGAIITFVIMFGSVIKFWIRQPVTNEFKKPGKENV